MARSGPGGPAQPLQVSRLHRHASCITCATSPLPTPSLALAPPRPENRPNSNRNPWIEVGLGQIGTRGSRTVSEGFQVPTTRIMSHLSHLTPSSTLPRTHRRTRVQIVLTETGILGLRSRLARSGPGGPAQPLQVSRLHRHASCLTCATSPHPTPSLALALPCPENRPNSGRNPWIEVGLEKNLKNEHGGKWAIRTWVHGSRNAGVAG